MVNRAQQPLSGDGSLREQLALRYDLADEHVTAAGRPYVITRVRDTNALVDAIDPATFAVDERLPYWAEVWASSIGLADWIGEHRPAAGTGILELGCGLGLPGIAAAAAGADVTLTDFEEDALLFSRHNALANLDRAIVDQRMRFKLLDWRTPELDREYDLVLGADITYERRSFAPLLDVLRRAVAPGGIAVFAEPDRTVGENFFQFAAGSGFSLERSKRTAPQQGRTIQVHIVVLRHSGAA
jgi:predicted nicotinamide N-methyase